MLMRGENKSVHLFSFTVNGTQIGNVIAVNT